jgi:WD40 repeat protein/tRNA A-37 threonylcarbamoyl transferase component Bud32
MSPSEGLPPTVASPTDTKNPPLTVAGPPAPDAPAPFDVPGYELLGELGRGGMGVVYKARQLAANRVVALKMVLRGQFASPDEVARFRAEAEAAAALDHPNIVPIYEVGEYQGQHYYAMKIIEGPTLDGLLPGLVKSPREAAQLLARVARAVHYAHQRGVLHRDIKPANILTDASGEPYVADFGLARRLEGHSELSRSGAIIGTPGYMSPEQAAARKDLTVAVDVYSLGAILYEALTGKPPFREASTMETLLAVMERDPSPPSQTNPDVPVDLETICLKCLHKEPDKRYASAADLADDLERFLNGEPIQARPVGWGERAWKWVRRRPGVAALLALLLLTVCAGIGGVVWHWRDALDARKEADARAAAEGEERRKADSERKKAVAAGKNLAVAQTATQKALDRVREERDLKDVVLQESISLHLAAEARSTIERDTVLSLLLGAEAVRRHSNPLSWDILQRALGESREERQLAPPEGGRLVSASYAGPGSVRLLAWDKGVPAIRTGEGAWVRLRGPAGLFGRVALSPDGKRAATVINGHLVLVHPDNKEYLYTSRMAHVWDTATGKELFRLHRHDNNITDVEFSADGKHILTASWDGTARLWDASSGKQAAVLRRDKEALRLATFSPDGAHVLTLLTSRADQMAYPEKEHPRPGAIDPPAIVQMRPNPRDRFQHSFTSFRSHFSFTGPFSDTTMGYVWDVKGGKPVRLKPSEKHEASVATFTPDGEYAAIGTKDGPTLVFDATTGKQEKALAGDSTVQVLAFASKGKYLLVGHADGKVRIWHVSSGVEQRVLKGQRGAARCIACSADGKTVLTGAEDARLWDFATGQLLAVLRGHTGPVYHCDFSPDGQRVLTAGKNLARIWSVRVPTLEQLAHQGKAVLLALEYADDGRLLFADKEGSIWVRPAGGGQPLALTKAGALGELKSANFCLNGAGVVTASATCRVTYGEKVLSDSAVHILDARNGANLLSLKDHKTGAEGVLISPDGKRIYTNSSGVISEKATDLATTLNSRQAEPRQGTVRVWSDKGELVRTLPGTFRNGPMPPLTRDGRYLVWAGLKAEERGLMDVETGKLVRRLRPVGKTRPTNLIASPDGNWFASDGERKEPRVYRADTAKAHMKFAELSGPVRLNGFSKDGKRLLMIVGPDVCVWDVPGRRLVSMITRPRDSASVASFSGDGKLVAVGYASGAVALVDAETGKLRSQYPQRGGAPAMLAFSPDGKDLAAAVGGSVHLWPVDPWPFIRSRCPRELTKAERRRYALDAPRPGEEKRPVAVLP